MFIYGYILDVVFMFAGTIHTFCFYKYVIVEHPFLYVSSVGVHFLPCGIKSIFNRGRKTQVVSAANRLIKFVFKFCFFLNLKMIESFFNFLFYDPFVIYSILKPHNCLSKWGPDPSFGHLQFKDCVFNIWLSR